MKASFSLGRYPLGKRIRFGGSPDAVAVLFALVVALDVGLALLLFGVLAAALPGAAFFVVDFSARAFTPVVEPVAVDFFVVTDFFASTVFFAVPDFAAVAVLLSPPAFLDAPVAFFTAAAVLAEAGFLAAVAFFTTGLVAVFLEAGLDCRLTAVFAAPVLGCAADDRVLPAARELR
jgi:hypothetical protein